MISTSKTSVPKRPAAALEGEQLSPLTTRCLSGGIDLWPPVLAATTSLRWLRCLSTGLKQEPYLLLAERGRQVVGHLPLMLVSSRLFGRYLVSLPYINSAGVQSSDEAAASLLIDRAVQLADQLDVSYLELRHEQPVDHPFLAHRDASKAHMRLALAGDVERRWSELKSKVRSQVRKAGEHQLQVKWGHVERLNDFYAVFAHNMRDLGTPVFSRQLFAQVLGQFAADAELCVVYSATRPVAAALLVHDGPTTHVPSASSLRSMNHTNANMLMYWHLQKRAIERGQRTFDFGRSTVDSSTYRFKKQWGAQPHPAVWQYYLRRGSIGDMRPGNNRYRAMIALWRQLPVSLTRLIGPPIVRGIP